MLKEAFLLGLAEIGRDKRPFELEIKVEVATPFITFSWSLGERHTWSKSWKNKNKNKWKNKMKNENKKENKEYLWQAKKDYWCEKHLK